MSVALSASAVKLVKEGKFSQSDAARFFGITRQSVSRQMHLWPNGNPKRINGLTIQQKLAKELNLSAGRISQMKKLGCPMSSVEEVRRWMGERSIIRHTKEKPLEVLTTKDPLGAGFVYLLIEKGGTCLKIGFSRKKPLARCKDCQTGNPRKLYAVHFRRHDSAFEIERRLHHKFHKRRLNGEWFDVEIWEVLEEMDKIYGWKPVIYQDEASWDFETQQKETP